MNEAHQCPQCKTYIFGTYCHKCKQDIYEMPLPKDNKHQMFDQEGLDFLKDLFHL